MHTWDDFLEEKDKQDILRKVLAQPFSGNLARFCVAEKESVLWLEKNLQEEKLGGIFHIFDKIRLASSSKKGLQKEDLKAYIARQLSNSIAHKILDIVMSALWSSPLPERHLQAKPEWFLETAYQFEDRKCVWIMHPELIAKFIKQTSSPYLHGHFMVSCDLETKTEDGTYVSYLLPTSSSFVIGKNKESHPIRISFTNPDMCVSELPQGDGLPPRCQFGIEGKITVCVGDGVRIFTEVPGSEPGNWRRVCEEDRFC